jgi:hypothetical protein
MLNLFARVEAFGCLSVPSLRRSLFPEIGVAAADAFFRVSPERVKRITSIIHGIEQYNLTPLGCLPFGKTDPLRTGSRRRHKLGEGWDRSTRRPK